MCLQLCCACVFVTVCIITADIFLSNMSLRPSALILCIPSVRTHAGNGEGFLEDGLAGKLGLYRHGYKSGGGGKGEFIFSTIKNVCVLRVRGNFYFPSCVRSWTFGFVIITRHSA